MTKEIAGVDKDVLSIWTSKIYCPFFDLDDREP